MLSQYLASSSVVFLGETVCCLLQPMCSPASASSYKLLPATAIPAEHSVVGDHQGYIGSSAVLLSLIGLFSAELV